MIKYLSALLLALLIGACCMAQKESDSKSIESTKEKSQLFKTFESGEICYTIGDEYAGEFIIGDGIPLQEHLNNFVIRKEKIAKSRNKDSENLPYYYIISMNGKEMLYLIPMMAKDEKNSVESIKEIIVVSEKFKTFNGFAVKNRIASIVDNNQLLSLYYSLKDGLIHLEIKNFKGEFLILPDAYNGEFSDLTSSEKINLDSIKTNATVYAIRVF
jgi:hypothetical protein